MAEGKLSANFLLTKLNDSNYNAHQLDVTNLN